MKFLILGLGNFGSSLGMKLSGLGHEVLGADNDMGKVEFLKNKITHTVCLDSTDVPAVSQLPLKEIDCAIVAIGENEGANIMATAVLKQLKLKRIIARAVSPLHETVLEAMGITEIIHPEEDSADRLSKKLNIKGILDSFSLTDKYNIIEAQVPDQYVGWLVKEVNFKEKHKVNLLTIIRGVDRKNILGISRKVNEIMGVLGPETNLEKDDILVLFGDIRDIESFLSQ